MPSKFLYKTIDTHKALAPLGTMTATLDTNVMPFAGAKRIPFMSSVARFVVYDRNAWHTRNVMPFAGAKDIPFLVCQTVARSFPSGDMTATLDSHKT